MTKESKRIALNRILFAGIFLLLILLLVVVFAQINKDLYTNKIDQHQLNALIDDENAQVVYFYNEDCPTCQTVSKIAYPYAKENDIIIHSYDVTTQPTAEYQITHTPTLVIYRAGQERDRFRGFPGEEYIESFLDQVGDIE